MSIRCIRTRFTCLLGAIVLLSFSASLPVARSQTPAAPAAPYIFHFKRFLISDTDEKTQQLLKSTEPGPVVVGDMPLLSTPEFAAVLKPYLGQVVGEDSLRKLGNDIVAFVKAHDRPVVGVQFPTQNLPDILAGTLRVIVVIGRYSDLQFKGNRYFSRQLLQAELGIKPGDEIRLSSLEDAMNWVNTNPFNKITPLINTMNKPPGAADLDISVQEQLPVRVSASYDDTGAAFIGTNRYTTSVQLGNLWGQGHQLSYQFSTTDVSHLFEAQSLDYKVPLPWKSYLQADVAYAIVRPTYLANVFSEEGKNVICDLRYEHQFQRGSWTIDTSTGIDFKQTNNNILFGGYQINKANNVAQATESVTAIHRDTLGAWSIGSSFDESPGNINSKNSQTAIELSRGVARARYAYGDVFMQRLTVLPYGFQLFTKAQAQLSTTNLLSSEELTIGGMSTVRGYNQNVYAGDNGWLFNQELQGPLWSTRLPFESKTAPPLQDRLLLFFDTGRVYYHKLTAASLELDPLMSAGVGLRSNVSSNFNLTLDFGWQLRQTEPPQPQTCRGDVRATLAF